LLAFLAAVPAPAAAAEPNAPADPAKAFPEDFDEDFAGEPAGLALGPVDSGKFVLSVDVGWLRSAIRGQAGVGRDFDLVFSADAFLLEDLFEHQNGFHAGVRYTPVQSRPFRLSVEAAVGATFIANRVSASNVFDLRGEVNAGVVQPGLGTAYVRLQVRALTDGAAGESHWGRDAEFGLGVERNFGPLTLGAEGFVWTRPELDNLRQWRIRAGYRF
ncbi:MAG TPA: hypothetical protein VD838_17080, partial [Anaeromyxobacteraceae bacterium]|nr:hypothetical protein [Anaeromyxobacteraceae bacterium]